MKLKYLTTLIAMAAFGAIIYGFTLKEQDESLGNRYIGFGTLALFFVAMPLFLIKESKGKKMKDYMLTHENIDKMRKKNKEKTDNQ